VRTDAILDYVPGPTTHLDEDPSDVFTDQVQQKKENAKQEGDHRDGAGLAGDSAIEANLHHHGMGTPLRAEKTQ
jgi:hypothetical protein